VPSLGQVRVTDALAEGRRSVVVDRVSGSDCTSGTVEPPAGRDCARLDYISPTGNASAEACCEVRAALQASPSSAGSTTPPLILP
jgi:hypothetical protein